MVKTFDFKICGSEFLCVILKTLNHSANVEKDFFNEVRKVREFLLPPRLKAKVG